MIGLISAGRKEETARPGTRRKWWLSLKNVEKQPTPKMTLFDFPSADTTGNSQRQNTK